MTDDSPQQQYQKDLDAAAAKFNTANGAADKKYHDRANDADKQKTKELADAGLGLKHA